MLGRGMVQLAYLRHDIARLRVRAVCVPELAVMRHVEEQEAEAARRSAYRAEFFREMDKPL